MADHGTVEYATAKGNDLAAHEAGYEDFGHLAFVGTMHVISVVIGLCIVGVTDHCGIAVTLTMFATFVAMHGLASGAKVPSAVMVVISLLGLALTTT